MTKTTPQWKLDKIEELVKIYMDCGVSESLARETAWRFKEQLEKELTEATGVRI